MFTRFFVLTNNAESLAVSLIEAPKVIGRRRAQMLFDLAVFGDTKQDRYLGRYALKQCARAANRHRVILDDQTILTDRVFNKASTLRLKYWAQNVNTPV